MQLVALQDRWHSVAEAAESLAVSPEELGLMIRRGQLVAITDIAGQRVRPRLVHVPAQRGHSGSADTRSAPRPVGDKASSSGPSASGEAAGQQRAGELEGARTPARRKRGQAARTRPRPAR
jgi:hypothetical protein